MIIGRAINYIRDIATPGFIQREISQGISVMTNSGQAVSPESAKRIATVYRCANILANDVAKMPLQLFVSRQTGDIERVRPDPIRRNMAYLAEVQPNLHQTAFIFKKTAMRWLLFWGNAYIWKPNLRVPQMYVLPSNLVTSYFDGNDMRWYDVNIDGQVEHIPEVEISHYMINSDDGKNGRSVLTFARETLGRRQAANETQNVLYGEGLMPAAVAQFPGDLSKEAREKIRQAYSEAVSGSANAGRLLILDGKVTKFETVPIKAADAQFLESISATEVDIANFFDVPLYKLNMGKEAYNSNEQRNLDYLASTLDSYLVQIEQESQIKWLTGAEQVYSYWRFNRNSLLRTDAKSRGEYLQGKILSGQMSPNEARAVEDEPAYPGGENRYVPSNMAVIGPDGTVKMISGGANGS